ncbi:GNAT family N-acetyltransferase [Massilia sp. HP4]|uniref:GNAT family N-acetyltransferase n=1 Tax=Massilia sp. HP4 TaxID=2562316 RepID=UPI0014858A63|nr:GNAT family N-acetyltransferase [Massilia sp. HP4]
MSRRCFGRLGARLPGPADAAFLDALYLDARPDLGALPVPRSVIEGIARHQRRLQVEDYARRYPLCETWLLLEEERPVARVVLDRSGGVLRVVDLSVAASARRRGVARTVLHALQEEGTAMALRVLTVNAAARALYAKLGFTLQRSEPAALELGWNRGQNE